MDLSVVIPAKNEEWLRRTVEDVLAHSERETEVIVIADGGWPPVALDAHQRVQVLYVPTSIGQRAATNIGVKLSTAKYVMKLDAHCTVSQGFDRVLIEAAEQLGPDVTQIPAQRHLHVYDQVCPACAHQADQAPHWNGKCPKCNRTITVRRIVTWEVRKRPTTTAWRVDHTLHFNYWSEGQKRQGEGDIHDTMANLGACYFMEREYYWRLDGLDEGHGSWGQMGCEVGLKTWLSGGRHVVNKGCFFSHFFRVGGIGFSHTVTNADQDRARTYSRDLWMNNRWPKQIYPLSWLIEKFKPLPDWHDPVGAAALKQVMSAGAAFTSRKKRRDSVGGDPSQVGGVRADATVPVPALALAGVGQLGQEVSPGAVRSSGLVGDVAGAAHDVVADGDLSQVGRVAAQDVAADVVNDQAVGIQCRAQGPVDPRAQNTVDANLGAGGATVGESNPGIAGLSAGVAGPVPATGGVVDGDLTEDPCKLLSVEMVDREILVGSHASALHAGVGLGAGACDQHAPAPYILPPKGSAGCCYYSDCLPPPSILDPVRHSIADSGLPIVAVTLAPIDWPAARNLVLPLERGYLAMFKQILAGLEALDTEFAFLTEHDVRYHPSHFQFRPPQPDVCYYNLNMWKLHAETGQAVTYETKQTSGLCANRLLLVEHYRKRVEIVERDGFSRAQGFEPGSHGRKERVDNVTSDVWRSAFPNVDIRHGSNLTASRWHPSQFRDPRNCRGWAEADEIPGWGWTKGRVAEWLDETAC